MIKWSQFNDKPLEFVKLWMNLPEFTYHQKKWMLQLTGLEPRRVGLVYPRSSAPLMAGTLVAAAVWRAFVLQQHSQMIVSHEKAGLAWLHAMKCILAPANQIVKDQFIYTRSGYITQDDVAVWRLVRCFPENLYLGTSNCDLYIGDFDRIPNDLLNAAFNAELNGLLIFPTSSGKWPNHM